MEVTESEKIYSPNTISFTCATRVPNTFSAWHAIIPWSSKRTSIISNILPVRLNRLWLPWFPLCKDHVILGAGFPDAEILSDSLAPSLIAMDGGILEVKRGGAVKRWWYQAVKRNKLIMNGYNICSVSQSKFLLKSTSEVLSLDVYSPNFVISLWV